MSSLMPSVSTFVVKTTSPGEGGGVCSAAPRLDFGLGGCTSATGDPPFERGDETGDIGAWSSCVRFNLLFGCCGGVSVLATDFWFGR